MREVPTLVATTCTTTPVQERLITFPHFVSAIIYFMIIKGNLPSKTAAILKSSNFDDSHLLKSLIICLQKLVNIVLLTVPRIKRTLAHNIRPKH